jgi:ribonuclease P protein component
VSLPKKHRLKNWRNFKTIYEKGRFYQGTNLNLKALLDPPIVNAHQTNNQSNDQIQIEEINLAPPCLGISISKKVSKKAVIRNRIKRLIKASFRELLPLINPGWKLIIIVRSTAIECQYEHFLRELKKLFIKAGIINGH